MSYHSIFFLNRQRAYFEDVHILIPKTWSDNSNYENPTWQQVDKSDIVIGPFPSDTPPSSGDSSQEQNRPFTIKTTPCGELGQYIHLTPEYVIDESIAASFGTYEKVSLFICFFF